MQTLRHARRLAGFILVWFALSLGVAIASPVVKPQPMALICSAAGVLQLLIQGDTGDTTPASHTLDCPLCATGNAPPLPLLQRRVVPAQPLAQQLPGIAASHIASRTAAPPPARGPPTVS